AGEPFARDEILDPVVEALNGGADFGRALAVLVLQAARETVHALVQSLDGIKPCRIAARVPFGRTRRFFHAVRELIEPFGKFVETAFNGIGGGAIGRCWALRRAPALVGSLTDCRFEPFSDRLAGSPCG